MSNATRLLVLGTPLLLAGLELTHPAHVGHDVPGRFFPIAGWWLALHLAQFVLFGGMGVAVWLLTAGDRGPAVVASRIGAVIFVAGYDLGDAVFGVAAGVLGRGAGALPPAVRDGRAEAVAALFHDPLVNAVYDVGRAGWVLAMLSASAAVYVRRGRPVPAVCLALSGGLLWAFDHPGPAGAVAFGCFFAAAAALDRNGAQSRPGSVR